MGRKADQTTTTTQRLDPFIQEQMEDVMNRGRQVADMPFEAFPGTRVAPMQPLQQQAADFLTQTFSSPTGTGVAQAQQAAGIAGQIAQGGTSPMVDPAMVQTGDVRAGIGLYSDPFENQVVNTALSDIDRARQLATQDVRSAATRAGAFGGDRAALLEAETNRGFADAAARTAAQLRSQGFGRAADLAQADASRALTAGIANQGAGLTGQLANQSAFFQGRGQQLQGAGLLSQFGGDIFNRNLGAGEALFGVGDRFQNQAQAELSDEVARFYEQRNFPREQVQFLASLLGGVPFGQSQTTTQPGGSRAAGVLGGAGAGAGAGFMIGGPLGAGIGAGVGGLLGLF